MRGSLLQFVFGAMVLLFAPPAANAQQTKTDAFGDPLPMGAIARIGTTKYRAQNRNLARLSDDGKLLAVPGRPGEIDVWQVPSWTNRRVLRVGSSSKEKAPDLQYLAFTSDSKTLAACDIANRQIQFFDLALGKCSRIIQLPGETQFRKIEIVISRDRQTLVIAGDNHQETHWFVWNLATDKLKHTFSVGGERSFAVSDDCRWCAVEQQDFVLEVRDLATGQSVYTIPVDCAMRGMAFSPDAKRLVVSGRATVRLYEVATGKELYNQRRRDGWVCHVAFTPDGKSFYLCDVHCKDVALWDAATGEQTATYTLPTTWEHARQLVFTPEGKVLALTQTQYLHANILDVWDLHAGKLISPNGVPRLWINEVCFSPLGELYVASGGHQAAWWNARTGKKIRDHVLDAETINLNFEWSMNPHRTKPSLFENGAKAAMLGRYTVRIWNTRTRRETSKFVVPLEQNENTTTMAVSADGNSFAITTVTEVNKKHEYKLLLWNQEQQSIVRAYPRQAPRNNMDGGVFSPDNRWLAFFAVDGRLQLSRLDQAAANSFVDLNKDESKMQDMVFSHDGRQLAYTMPGKICICETASGKIRHELAGDPDSDIDHLAYSHDGALLAGGSHYTSVLVWQAGLRAFVDTSAKKEPSRKELETCFLALAAPDARAAFQAMIKLVQAPNAAVQLLQQKIPPATKPAREILSYRAVEVLEAIGTAEARTLLTRWSTGTPAAVLTEEAQTALRRIR